jgi:hypothetical protein
MGINLPINYYETAFICYYNFIDILDVIYEAAVACYYNFIDICLIVSEIEPYF